MNRNRILIIEDDKEISGFVTSFLREKDYHVMCSYNGAVGMEMAINEDPDIILLDIMLPFHSGDEILSNIQKIKHIPTIIVSAKSMTQTKVDILRLGADDYITKPFDMNELLARIEALLKRSYPQIQTTMEYGELLLDFETKQFFVNGTLVPITTKEYHLLELFLSNQHKVFSKQNLYESIWNEVYSYDDDTINTHISNLRKKIKAHAKHEYIQTIWGMGYKLKLL